MFIARVLGVVAPFAVGSANGVFAYLSFATGDPVFGVVFAVFGIASVVSTYALWFRAEGGVPLKLGLSLLLMVCPVIGFFLFLSFFSSDRELALPAKAD